MSNERTSIIIERLVEFSSMVKDLEPKIIYEERGFLAINKPSGLLVHGVSGNGDKESNQPTLVDWLINKYPEIKMVGDNPDERPGVVHRLDKETSGIILAAKDQESFIFLKSLFKDRKIEKIYLAVVFGEVSEKSGSVEKPIGIKSGTTKRSVYSEKMQKDAVTEYSVIMVFKKPGFDDKLSLLEVRPKTGRTHQIRVHLASIGHPVVGDILYGKKNKGEASLVSRLMLHAFALEFTKKDGERIKIEADPPEDFKDFAGI